MRSPMADAPRVGVPVDRFVPRVARGNVSVVAAALEGSPHVGRPSALHDGAASAAPPLAKPSLPRCQVSGVGGGSVVSAGSAGCIGVAGMDCPPPPA